jgi:DNA invertase Pin-like site-specific DNA recombinase
MDFIERDEKLRELKKLIDKGTTGSAAELAFRLHVSRATLFRLMNHLAIREGHPIRYCKLKKCYCFEKNEK